MLQIDDKTLLPVAPTEPPEMLSGGTREQVVVPVRLASVRLDARAGTAVRSDLFSLLAASWCMRMGLDFALRFGEVFGFWGGSAQ